MNKDNSHNFSLKNELSFVIVDMVNSVLTLFRALNDSGI